MGRIHVSSILPGLCEHAGVPMADVLGALRAAFWLRSFVPRDFRSAGQAPSQAGAWRSGGRAIDFPDGMPHVAGTWGDHGLRLTGIALSPSAFWYGEFNDAKMVLKGVELPLSVLGGMAGRRIGEVVGHPALRDLDETVVDARVNGGHTTLRLTAAAIEIADPLDDAGRGEWEDRGRRASQARGGRMAA